jgi:hypothetical protein
MPLLAELMVPGGASAINMSVLTDLAQKRRLRLASVAAVRMPSACNWLMARLTVL